MTHDFTGAPCLNRWLLFTEMTDPASQHEARELCGTCPARHFAACQTVLEDQLGRTRYLPAGTWAGRSFTESGETTVRKPRRRKKAA